MKLSDLSVPGVSLSAHQQEAADMGNTSEEFFARNARDQDPLLDDLKTMVKQHSRSFARSTQVALGPSQVGHPCARNVISGLMGSDTPDNRSNPQFDPLPSYIGTAAHVAMEDAAKLANEKIHEEFKRECDKISDPDTRMHKLDTFQPRYLTERKVYVAEGLSGTCDLYDTWTNTVIDYKFPGTTMMAEYRKNGPSTVYRVQAHLYGKGYRNEGYPVERVGIWFLPRSGLLSTSKLWVEAYDEELVQQQIQRLYDLMILVNDMDIEHHPERLALIPITPYGCSFCPYFSVNPQRAAKNPYACLGGEDYQPQITDHSGARPV